MRTLGNVLVGAVLLVVVLVCISIGTGAFFWLVRPLFWPVLIASLAEVIWRHIVKENRT